MSELLPCPMCGSADVKTFCKSEGEQCGYEYVVRNSCNGCGVSQSTSSTSDKNGWNNEASASVKVRAIERWNRRAPVQASEARGDWADLESDLETTIDHNIALQGVINDAIKIHTSFGSTADMADWLRDALEDAAAPDSAHTQAGPVG